MLQVWLNKGFAGTSETKRDTAKLALHVLTSAGFGISYPFDGGVKELAPGYSLTFADALWNVLENIITLNILPKKGLGAPMMPRGLRKLSRATHEFQRYMEEMVENQRDKISKQNSGEVNLMTVLVQASEEARQSSKPSLAFADDEVFGNIFIYALAGHESTANTIHYGLVLLAAHPERQEWLAEEIDHVLGKHAVIRKENYEEVFPRLKRCHAVLVSSLN